MIRVGVIGVGGISGGHLRAYQTHASAQLVAICDSDAGRLRDVAARLDAEGTPVIAYAAHDALLADAEIDAVDICLPTDLHAPVSLAALRAGKHVLCEKPMALNVEECDAMIAAASDADRVLMVAHCLRFWPEYLALKDLVESGRYGAVRGASFCRMGGRPQWSADHWMHDPARSGGSILDLHIHDADFVRFLFGDPEHVSATGVTDRYGVSYASATYRFPDGMTVTATGGWLAPAFPFRMTFNVLFDEAAVEWDSARGPLTVYPESGEAQQPVLPEDNATRREIAYFLECIEQGHAPEIITPRDAREAVRLVMLEKASIAQGIPMPCCGV